MRTSFLLLFFIPFLSFAQKKNISLDDIFKKGIFNGESFGGFTKIDKDSLFPASGLSDAEGKKIETGNYEFSPDKKTVLFLMEKNLYTEGPRSLLYIFTILPPNK